MIFGIKGHFCFGIGMEDPKYENWGLGTLSSTNI